MVNTIVSAFVDYMLKKEKEKYNILVFSYLTMYYTETIAETLAV